MRVFPRTLGITALLLTPAFHAAMAQEPAPAGTEPPPATTPAAGGCSREQPDERRHGRVRQPGTDRHQRRSAVTNEAPQFAIYHHSVSMGGGAHDHQHPALAGLLRGPEHFSWRSDRGPARVADLFGGSGNDTATAFGLELRGGYNLALNDMFSIWPHIGIALRAREHQQRRQLGYAGT